VREQTEEAVVEAAVPKAPEFKMVELEVLVS
jgi:hypothetical protein